MVIRSRAFWRFIALLLAPRGPANVADFVVPVVVDAIQGHASRTWPDGFNNLLRTGESELNAPSAIERPMIVVWIGAPTLRCFVGNHCGCIRQTVSRSGTIIGAVSAVRWVLETELWHVAFFRSGVGKSAPGFNGLSLMVTIPRLH